MRSMPLLKLKLSEIHSSNNGKGADSSCATVVFTCGSRPHQIPISRMSSADRPRIFQSALDCLASRFAVEVAFATPLDFTKNYPPSQNRFKNRFDLAF